MDSRFHIKVHFEIYGKKYDWDASLNWSGYAGEIDSRIRDFFLNCHDEAYAIWLRRLAESQADKESKEARVRELDELRRLKAKYPEEQ